MYCKPSSFVSLADSCRLEKEESGRVGRCLLLPFKSKSLAAKAFSELIRRPVPLSREMDFHSSTLLFSPSRAKL